MTAEIVILNSEAVALAADSAVTADWGEETKVLYSQTKIFELTHSAQVAVMIYGRHHFMSLPLDIIIADYKRKHGHVTYPKLNDYVAAFTDHMVQVVDSHVSTEDQLRQQLSRVEAIFEAIQQSVNRLMRSYWEEQREKGETVSPDEFETLGRELTMDEIDKCLESFKDVELVEGFTEELIERARAEMQPHLQEVREGLFGDDLAADTAAKLDEIAHRSIGVMIGDLIPGRLPSVSGIVFAGFADEELLPGYVEIEVEAVYGQHLRMDRSSDGRIGREISSIIKAFAQTDMVAMFVEGVQPSYNEAVADVVQTEFEKNCVELASDTELPRETRDQLKNKLEDRSSEFVNKVMDELRDRRDNYSGRLLQAVESLSKTEMAEMAEALINLTSIDRKVSFSDESVGGPTDVAVITKADGLVWVKRKDTVSRDLNPGYYARMYGTDS